MLDKENELMQALVEDEASKQEKLTQQVSEFSIMKIGIKFVLIAVIGALLVMPLQNNVRSRVVNEVVELGYPSSEIEEIIYNGSQADVIFKTYCPMETMTFKKSYFGWKLTEKTLR